MITEQDRQRQIDRDLLDKLNPSPCPICHRLRESLMAQRAFTDWAEPVPMIYRARWTGKWMMRSGPIGCRHMDEPQFRGLHDYPQALAGLWESWCKAQTLSPSPVAAGA